MKTREDRITKIEKEFETLSVEDKLLVEVFINELRAARKANKPA